MQILAVQAFSSEQPSLLIRCYLVLILTVFTLEVSFIFVAFSHSHQQMVIIYILPTMVVS